MPRDASTGLRPFWRYYGAKWRIAPRYPAPRHRTIIEPFAGAAGYSLRYPDREVILVEKYHVIAEIWRWLISATPDEVRAIPNTAAAEPRLTLSAGCRAHRARGHGKLWGWTEALRERVASQVTAIKHWQIIEGDYSAAPDIVATWFVDAPYRGRQGRHYIHPSGRLDYPALARWCRARCGQTIVCEAAGADWLPFAPFGEVHGMSGAPSREAIWWQDSARSQELLPLEVA